MVEYSRLPDDEYAKLIGQFRLRLNGIMRPFNAYGMNVYVSQACEQIVQLTEIFGMNVRGKKKPLPIIEISGAPDD